MRTTSVLRLFCALLFLSIFNSVANSQEMVFRVYPHIVRNDDGTGGITNSQLTQSKQLLNSIFNPYEIFFEYECTNYIHDTFLSIDPATICDGFLPYYNTNGIDMFILSDDAEVGGFADFIPGTAVTVGGIFDPVCNDWTGSNPGSLPVPARLSILAHEMGHALGLFHTFESEPGSSSSVGCSPVHIGSCPELVDRSGDDCGGPNCDTCGDKVCDTPADAHDQEYHYDPCDCTSIVDFYDACGDLIVPNGRNIMAYSPAYCRTELTEGQANRIKTIMAGSPFLTERGSTDLCSASLCCDLEEKSVCIMDDQCDSYFVDHCETCSVQWISPFSGGTDNCVRIEDDPNFIYQAYVFQVVNGVTYPTFLEGTLDDFCMQDYDVRPYLGILNNDITSYVYPNPTYDNLFVNNEEDYDIEYALYDFNGQLIVKKIVSSHSIINLNDSRKLPEGIYFGRYLNNENSILKTERILIMR